MVAVVSLHEISTSISIHSPNTFTSLRILHLCHPSLRHSSSSSLSTLHVLLQSGSRTGRGRVSAVAFSRTSIWIWYMITSDVPVCCVCESWDNLDLKSSSIGQLLWATVSARRKRRSLQTRWRILFFAVLCYACVMRTGFRDNPSAGFRRASWKTYTARRPWWTIYVRFWLGGVPWQKRDVLRVD